MNRTEALKVLHLDEGSDSRAVETSYWTLVRHAQTRSPDETTAAREVEAQQSLRRPDAHSFADGDGANEPKACARRRGRTCGDGRRLPCLHSNIIDAALAWLGGGGRPRSSAMGRTQCRSCAYQRRRCCAGSRRAHGQRLVAHRPGMRRGRLRWGMVTVAQRAP